MKEIKIGDKVKFDGNHGGVTPRIATATIKEIRGGLATHGYTNPGRVFKVQGESGNIFCIDEQQIPPIRMKWCSPASAGFCCAKIS